MRVPYCPDLSAESGASRATLLLARGPPPCMNRGGESPEQTAESVGSGKLASPLSEEPGNCTTSLLQGDEEPVRQGWGTEQRQDTRGSRRERRQSAPRCTAFVAARPTRSSRAANWKQLRRFWVSARPPRWPTRAVPLNPALSGSRAVKIPRPACGGQPRAAAGRGAGRRGSAGAGTPGGGGAGGAQGSGRGAAVGRGGGGPQGLGRGAVAERGGGGREGLGRGAGGARRGPREWRTAGREGRGGRGTGRSPCVLLKASQPACLGARASSPLSWAGTASLAGGVGVGVSWKVLETLPGTGRCSQDFHRSHHCYGASTHRGRLFLLLTKKP